MLETLFNRWRKTESRPSAGLPAAPERAHAPPPTPEPTPAVVAPWRFVRRRPVIDRAGSICGWDLQLAASAVERAERSAAPAALHAVHRHALIQGARLVADSGRTALISTSAATLADPGFVAALPARSIVRCGDAYALPESSVCALDSHLRVRRLALAHETAPTSIRLLDAARYGNTQALRAALADHRGRDSGIAINLDSIDELGEAIRAGYKWCCGAHTRSARPPRHDKLAPLVANTASILTAVLAGKPPRAVAQQIKADVALSFRLLSIVNSAAYGLSRPADSVETAVTLLGSRELARWLTAFLIKGDAGLPVAAALRETTLARARLCELLARETRAEAPETLFVVGAFSLLDVLLDVPLEVPLASARLPEPAVDALITASGPWHPYLSLARAAEKTDTAAIEQEAARFSLAPDRVGELADEAGNWAQNIAAALAAGDGNNK